MIQIQLIFLRVSLDLDFLIHFLKMEFKEMEMVFIIITELREEGHNMRMDHLMDNNNNEEVLTQ